MGMIRWGITAGAHDASLTVFDGYDIKFAAHAERSSGVKNDRDLNQSLIDQALEYGEPWAVHWYETSWLKRLRQLRAKQYKTALLRHGPKSQLARFGFDAMLVPPDDATQSMMTDVKFYNHRHHHSHAAAGYYTSPFTSAAVLVVDSIGEFETLTIWDGHGNNLRRVYSQGYPHSIGLWYSAMTQRIGLKPNEEEYILMGWAALGDPYKYYKRIKEDFFVNTDLNKYYEQINFKHNLHRGCLWWAPGLNTIQDYADIAAATQKIYEEIFVNLVQKTKKLTEQNNLVVMGGCALNCVANSLAYKYFDNVWIMPNPGDAGSSLGAVAAHYGKHLEWTGPYLGYDIKGKYPTDKIIAELNATGIVGVANGRAEFGPRALGNRSLLADPRGGDVKERVNAIKRRQEFRPFAPVIMEEYAQQYFDGPVGPYMQFTSKCKNPELFPAITHLDGTSRVQTVNKYQHPGLYATLKKWHKQTGCPMLLNTSLNIKGKPMVDTEADALQWQQEYGVKVV